MVGKCNWTMMSFMKTRVSLLPFIDPAKHSPKPSGVLCGTKSCF